MTLCPARLGNVTLTPEQRGTLFIEWVETQSTPDRHTDITHCHDLHLVQGVLRGPDVGPTSKRLIRGFLLFDSHMKLRVRSALCLHDDKRGKVCKECNALHKSRALSKKIQSMQPITNGAVPVAEQKLTATVVRHAKTIKLLRQEVRRLKKRLDDLKNVRRQLEERMELVSVAPEEIDETVLLIRLMHKKYDADYVASVAACKRDRSPADVASALADLQLMKDLFQCEVDNLDNYNKMGNKRGKIRFHPSVYAYAIVLSKKMGTEGYEALRNINKGLPSASAISKKLIATTRLDAMSSGNGIDHDAILGLAALLFDHDSGQHPREAPDRLLLSLDEMDIVKGVAMRNNVVEGIVAYDDPLEAAIRAHVSLLDGIRDKDGRPDEMDVSEFKDRCAKKVLVISIDCPCARNARAVVMRRFVTSYGTDNFYEAVISVMQALAVHSLYVSLIVYDGLAANRAFIRAFATHVGKTADGLEYHYGLHPSDETREVQCTPDISHAIKRVPKSLSKVDKRTIKLNGRQVSLWLMRELWYGFRVSAEGGVGALTIFPFVESDFVQTPWSQMNVGAAVRVLGHHMLNMSTKYIELGKGGREHFRDYDKYLGVQEMVARFSPVIAILNDRTENVGAGHPSIKILKDFLDWFIKWRDDSYALAGVNAGPKAQDAHFFPRQTAEDWVFMISTVIAYVEVQMINGLTCKIGKITQDGLEHLFSRVRHIAGDDRQTATKIGQAFASDAAVQGQSTCTKRSVGKRSCAAMEGEEPPDMIVHVDEVREIRQKRETAHALMAKPWCSVEGGMFVFRMRA